MKSRSIKISQSLTVAALSLLMSSAFGQSRQLEEVIVTAQKRAQSVLDVPIAVSAFTGESLEALITRD